MHVERDSAEWRTMWAAIAAKYGDSACMSEDGEVWQYMGTDGGLHQFRHRSLEQRFHPCAGGGTRRVYASVRVGGGHVTAVYQ